MGSVKPTYIKILAEDLLTRFPEAFTDVFEENKKKVEELTTITSKEVRNRVAGYITRHKNRGGYNV
jgi:small subunit ribosomal protein S17e